MAGYAMTPASFLAWRQRLGLNKRRAAEALGISRVTLDAYENGLHSIPLYIALACAAIAMGVPPITESPPRSALPPG